METLPSVRGSSIASLHQGSKPRVSERTWLNKGRTCFDWLISNQSISSLWVTAWALLSHRPLVFPFPEKHSDSGSVDVTIRVCPCGCVQCIWPVHGHASVDHSTLRCPCVWLLDAHSGLSTSRTLQDITSSQVPGSIVTSLPA